MEYFPRIPGTVQCEFRVHLFISNCNVYGARHSVSSFVMVSMKRHSPCIDSTSIDIFGGATSHMTEPRHAKCKCVNLCVLISLNASSMHVHGFGNSYPKRVWGKIWDNLDQLGLKYPNSSSIFTGNMDVLY